MTMLSVTPRAIMTIVSPAMVKAPTQTPMTISPGTRPETDTLPTFTKAPGTLTDAASGSAKGQGTFAPSWWPAKAPRVATTMKATLAKNGTNVRRNAGPMNDQADAQRWRSEWIGIDGFCGRPGKWGTAKSHQTPFCQFWQ